MRTLDYVNTLAALQGLIGKHVRVGAGVPGSAAPAVAQFDGILQFAYDPELAELPPPTTASGETVTFVLRRPGGAADETVGSFTLWREAFEGGFEPDLVWEGSPVPAVSFKCGGTNLLIAAVP